jgi:hypothetical protein
MHFFTDKPMLSAGLHAWIAFVRTTLFFIILDIIGYFTNLYNSGIKINFADAVGVLAPQVIYIVIRVVQRVAASVNSPLTPLISAAADQGVTSVTHLIESGGGALPDVSELPDAPQAPYPVQRPDTPPSR